MKIESVDGFQGMEKDYIIILTVRSNLSGKIGFLSSTKRLNVALTRAKKGVIILGNSECLAKRHGIWRDLINFYYSQGLIVQGPLSKLEKVPREEIFIKDIESEDEEEKEVLKLERHKQIKKEIVSDYFKLWEPAPAAEKEIKENENINKDNRSVEEKENEEKNDKNNLKRDKNKNRQKSFENEEEEEKEDKEKIKNEKKNKREEQKKDNKKKKKGSKKYSDNSSPEEVDEKKDKKKGKKKGKK